METLSLFSLVLRIKKVCLIKLKLTHATTDTVTTGTDSGLAHQYIRFIDYLFDQVSEPQTATGGDSYSPVIDSYSPVNDSSCGTETESGSESLNPKYYLYKYLISRWSVLNKYTHSHTNTHSLDQSESSTQTSQHAENHYSN